MPPFWGYPPMPPPQPNQDPVTTITSWIRGLEELKRHVKEEGKDKKAPEKKGPNASLVSMMLLMLLLSPITGPCMYYFFQLSLGIIGKH